MWYELDYPATWAGFNIFLTNVLGLFSSTLQAMMGIPPLMFFLAALLLAVVYALVLLSYRTAKKM